MTACAKTLAVMAALALAAAPTALAQGGGGGSNKRGGATVWRGYCKYGVFGPRGVLRVGTPAPTVSGANTRRGTRREVTRVRYRVFVTNAYSGAALVTSSWSGFLRVRQSSRRTWSGSTLFDMVWQGNYGSVVQIEWWNASRRVGWGNYRTGSFNFFDQYNRGPYGPISSCYKYTSY